MQRSQQYRSGVDILLGATWVNVPTSHRGRGGSSSRFHCRLIAAGVLLSTACGGASTSAPRTTATYQLLSINGQALPASGVDSSQRSVVAGMLTFVGLDSAKGTETDEPAPTAPGPPVETI